MANVVFGPVSRVLGNAQSLRVAAPGGVGRLENFANFFVCTWRQWRYLYEKRERIGTCVLNGGAATVLRSHGENYCCYEEWMENDSVCKVLTSITNPSIS